MNPLRRITLASTHVFHGATRSNESAVVHFSLRTEADPAPSGDTMWERLAPLFPRSEKPVFDGQPVDAVAPLQLFCHLLRALHSEALTEKDSVQLRENSNGSALVIAACEDAQTTLYAGDAESHVKVLLRPVSGPLIDIELTHANAFPQAACLVMGTQGSLTSDRQLIRWRYFDPAEVPPLIIDINPTPDRTYNSEELPWQEASYRPNHNYIREVRLLYNDLYRSVRNSAPFAISMESVRRQVAVLERCRELAPV